MLFTSQRFLCEEPYKDYHSASMTQAKELNSNPGMNPPVIYSLSIERFRCIEKLVWKPMRGINLILGGGDVGKTTILEAIALLLSPAAGATALDTDYYARRVEEGFSIHAVLSLPSESGITKQSKHFWPWRWDGEQAVIPTENADGASQVEAVYCLQVQGTPDLELQYEILQPNGETEHLSAGLRRELGLVRLAGDDRSDRDLRLVQGSALIVYFPTERSVPV